MPGPVSDSSKGPPDDGPFIPHWCYPNGAPKMCPCGHHEGYHGDSRVCLHAAKCGCTGLPDECHTSDEEFYGGSLP